MFAGGKEDRVVWYNGAGTTVTNVFSRDKPFSLDAWPMVWCIPPTYHNSIVRPGGTTIVCHRYMINPRLLGNWQGSIIFWPAIITGRPLDSPSDSKKRNDSNTSWPIFLG